ncbi:MULTISPECIES: response regulator [unclassified Bacillus cereus group]|uniref:response regulator n=1 Tax=unclassified Bacillus cereus group TaxID=2750818 RepID=UPI001F5A9EEC|nr:MULTISPECIES: response regulator [unclassified Bacillus cereus group]MDA1678398.1 response regulator [Bacillus cereus group sp. TH152-1LC]
MWRIVIIEDEKPILDLHNHLLTKHGGFQIIDTFQSPLEAINMLPDYTLDAILLDIEMPKMTGIELAKKLVDDGIDVPIIFSTAYPNYALEAFRVQALDYILKPLTPSAVQDLDDRLKKYYGVPNQQRNSNTLQVQLYGNTFIKKDHQSLKWPTRVTEELFYYFLLHKEKTVSKWQILDDIWPNIDEKRALANLYNTIYRIRQLFSELNIPLKIERTTDGYEMQINQTVQFIEAHNTDDLLLESKGYLWAYKLQNIQL